MGDVSIYSYLIAEGINIKQFRHDNPANLLINGSFELFYKTGDKYLYITSYGAVGFAGYEHKEIQGIIKRLAVYCEEPVSSEFKEDLVIREGGELEFGNNCLKVGTITPEVIRLTMINICHSVALDFYTDTGQHLLTQSVKYARILEKHGKFNVSKRDLLKAIGKALNLRNQIIDNLYIFDSPDIVWESEELGSVNMNLSRTFDLKNRFKELDYTLRIVENNLNTFSGLLQSKESNMLELIIIFLIMFEIIYMFFAEAGL